MRNLAQRIRDSARSIGWSAAVLLVLPGLLGGCRESPRGAAPATEVWPTPLPLPTLTIRVGGTPLVVEVADEEAERRRGLMYRSALPEDQGMLFVFPDDDFRRFWMRNTYLPLSIAYVAADGEIVTILDMEPHVEDGDYWSTRKARYAIETNQGWFDRHGVSVGDRVAIFSATGEAAP